MAYTITPVEANDTFQVWFDATNEVINAISTIVVSVNSHANGGLTTGNGFIEGTFGSRTFTANTVRGGTVQTPNVLTLSSNLNVTGDTITVGNVIINSTTITIDGIPLDTGGGTFEFTTTGTGGQVIDYWNKVNYRSAEYSVSVKDNTANAYQFSRVMVIHDAGDAYFTEFATISTNAALGDFSANANATHIRLVFTPTTANATVDGARVLVEV